MVKKALVVRLPGDVRRRLEGLGIKDHVPDMIPLFQEYAHRKVLPAGVAMMIRGVFYRYAKGNEILSLNLHHVAHLIVDALVDDKKVAERAKSHLRSLSRAERIGKDPI